jgi:AcrR family transcriptional regulator
VTPKRMQRATEILDAAADLLLRWGFKRVRIEDIAEQTGIGKGTIYLHWKTKEALFGALLMREVGFIWHAMIERLRADPQEVLFHRVMRSLLLTAMSRPLARALSTSDGELLGKMLRSSASVALRAHQRNAQDEVLAWLRSRGLLRDDMDFDVQLHAIRATVKGFLQLAGAPTEERGLSLEASAEALAETVHRAFEPPVPPSSEALREAAAQLLERLERLSSVLERAQHEPVGDE